MVQSLGRKVPIASITNEFNERNDNKKVLDDLKRKDM